MAQAMQHVGFVKAFDACVGHALTPQEKQDLIDANRKANYDWRKAREILLKKYSPEKLDAMLPQFDGYK